MVLLGLATFVGSLLCACSATSIAAYKRGYLAGQRDLMQDAEWWREAEEGVDQARMKIWREEEPKSGRWM